MKKNRPKSNLSESQEKYMRTIYRLELNGEIARVKDIAKIRHVKPGSVSPAMRILAQMDLITYVRREYIKLTPKGLAAAEKIEKKITILTTFFSQVLHQNENDAIDQTCAVEHSLSRETIDGIAKLLEASGVVKSSDSEIAQTDTQLQNRSSITISKMNTGQEAVISLIRAHGDLNDQIIKMGLLPDSKIKKKKRLKNGCIVALGGYEIILNEDQAGAVEVIL